MYYHIISLFIVISLIAFIYWSCQRDHIAVEDRDYLNALDYLSWKVEVDIKDEMEKQHEGWLTLDEVSVALARLESDGLVKRRWRRHIHIKEAGSMRTIEIPEYKRVLTPQDMGIPMLILVRPQAPQYA